MIEIIMDAEITGAGHNSLSGESGAEKMAVKTVNIERHSERFAGADEVDFRVAGKKLVEGGGVVGEGGMGRAREAF